MTVDQTNTQLMSDNSSLKILKEDSGTISVPNLPGAGDTFGAVTIPHEYGSDELLVQVWSSVGYSSGGTVLPFNSNDNRIIAYTKLDSVNLYIYIIHSDAGGFGFPASSHNYSYRILIP